MKTRNQAEPHVLYEDNHVIVAFKPAGYLSQADDSGKPDMLTWLKSYIKIQYQKPGDVFLGLVHRLDQPVSGLMVFARTSKAASRLSEQVRSHGLGKHYLAVVKGRPVPASGRLEDYLVKDRSSNQVRVCPDHEGQLAFLDYQIIQYQADRDCSLVSIQLGTGRSHQIRVQFASRGWPLIGDRRYGRAVRSDPDVALLACRLSFKHPTREERLDFSIEPPDTEPWNYFQGIM